MRIHVKEMDAYSTSLVSVLETVQEINRMNSDRHQRTKERREKRDKVHQLQQIIRGKRQTLHLKQELCPKFMSLQSVQKELGVQRVALEKSVKNLENSILGLHNDLSKGAINRPFEK